MAIFLPRMANILRKKKSQNTKNSYAKFLDLLTAFSYALVDPASSQSYHRNQLKNTTSRWHFLLIFAFFSKTKINNYFWHVFSMAKRTKMWKYKKEFFVKMINLTGNFTVRLDSNVFLKGFVIMVTSNGGFFFL